MVRVRSPAALRLATIRVRIASTAPSRPLGAPRARPDCAARAALTASSGIGLALTAAVLPVGAVDLDDPDTSCGDITGQSGAVTAGPFDADQGRRSQTCQVSPGRRAYPLAVAGNSCTPRSPPNRVKRCGDDAHGVGVYAAGNSARVFYDGHCRPLLWLRDGTHPLAVGPCEPRPLAQARQIRRAAPGGARNPDPADRSSLAGQPERRQPNRRSGRDPGPDHARTIAKPRKQGREAPSTVSLPNICCLPSSGRSAAPSTYQQDLRRQGAQTRPRPRSVLHRRPRARGRRAARLQRLCSPW